MFYIYNVVIIKMSSSVHNSRGQLQRIVDISTEIGEHRERLFKEYMEEKKEVHLVKRSKYKHYDFHPVNDKSLKIEFKTVNASINTYQNVFIGYDKISYYLYRKVKHPDFRFFLVYAFYDVNDATKTENIEYMYIEIDLEKSIKHYGRIIVYKKKHLKVPVKDLKPLKGLVEILKSTQ